MMEKSSRGSSHKGQAKSNKKPADPRTLFVKFFPPSASITRQHLSDHFSNYGPVNRCSVIRQSKSRQQQQPADTNEEPNLDRGSKGYGFVRFVHEDDAKSAADAILKKQSKRNSVGEVMVVDGVQYKLHAERAVDADKNNAHAAAPTPTPTASSAPKEKSDNNKSKESPQVTPSKETKNKENADDIYKAESKLKRTSRVIVRNLSFYANEKHIKSAMEINFGPVSAVDLPLVPELPNKDKNNNSSTEHKKNKNVVPRHRGFAFVTFTNANAAKQAVEKGGEITIKNRKVAIDFSVSKLEHQKMMKDKKEAKKEEESESDSESDSESENEEEKDSEGDSDDSEDDSDDSDSEEDDDSETEEENEDEESSEAKTDNKDNETAKETPEFDQSESSRTLFLRNIPFDGTRHDVFELFRKFGRIEAVYLVKDRQTGVFKGTAFVRFENEKGCIAAMEVAGVHDEPDQEGESSQFVSSKNMAMGLGQDGSASGLSLKGRHILVDLAVDRTTASSLAVQRDADGKPIKKMVGKDKRNLYLKNEGRVSSAADGGIAKDAGAKHGGTWEDLPPSDRARRERAFAERSTKLRSPLFFINPTRLSIRNLGKEINEAELKKLLFDALKTGLEQGLATPKDAVAHWRAGGELAHSEVMKRATDANLVTPPLDEKNMKESIPSVFVDRDVSGGKKMTDAPSKGFAFAEFTHHSHAMAVLRQLNNNPVYSKEFAAGGKHASEQGKRGKKSKKGKADPETGTEFLNEEGKVCVPRLIVEFTVENKIKARQQAEKISQKKANKIKQKIEKREKQQAEKKSDKKKESKKGRGTLQREKKRARKDAGEDEDNEKNDKSNASKKKKLDDANKAADKPKEKKQKTVKPTKKRKVDQDEIALEDMIRSYKTSFSKGEGTSKALSEDNKETEPKQKSRDSVAKKRWFE